MPPPPLLKPPPTLPHLETTTAQSPNGGSTHERGKLDFPASLSFGGELGYDPLPTKFWNSREYPSPGNNHGSGEHEGILAWGGAFEDYSYPPPPRQSPFVFFSSTSALPLPKTPTPYSHTRPPKANAKSLTPAAHRNVLLIFKSSFQPYYRNVSGTTTPDVWFGPSEVILVLLC
ncbi:hypothetical protein Cgig2_004678 [Carnegiea gigantea]|uniref:Uncharacterized protein n=1 Tax=Carnegiea gigantea TaxID=171969 RepID=A0A9Q1Q6W8_9CARY|nr:hypothetical protein Cgig2_004678 [Carnegiea gigantea]